MQLGGPNVDMQGGRFDGLVSNINEAANQLPSPFATAPSLLKIFRSKGLSASDMATLSGAYHFASPPLDLHSALHVLLILLKLFESNSLPVVLSSKLG